jgi:hypothetical protein
MVAVTRNGVRGQKPLKELPPCVAVSFAGVTASIAIAPGIPPAELKSALLHLFRKELKGYGSVAFEVVGVELTHDEKTKELVPLDVLARVPGVAIASEGESRDIVVALVTSPEMPTKKIEVPFPFRAALPGLIVFALYLVRTLISRPFLRALYRTGPSYRLGIGTIGFWEGAPLAAMCASLTGAQDASFWEKNRPQCKAIFGRKEDGFLIAVEAGALLLAAFLVYRHHLADAKKRAAALPDELYKFALDNKLVKPPADKPDPAQSAFAKYQMHMVVAAGYALGLVLFFYPAGIPYPA